MKKIEKNTVVKVVIFIVTPPILFFIWKNNHKIFFIINGFYSDFFGYPMIFLSAMADGLFVIMISSAAYGKKKGYYWSFMIAYIVSNSLVNLIKTAYSTGRPLAYYSMDEIYYAGEILKFQSFPSGHAAAAMVLSRYLAQNTGRKLTALIYTFGILCAISRVYIGVHFPYDVAFGACLGFIITHGVFWYAEKKYKHSARPEYKYNAWLISLIGLITAIFYLFYNNDLYAPISRLVNACALLFGVFFIYNILREFFILYKNKPAG
jgi:undecaprenyl-diphosphatase